MPDLVLPKIDAYAASCSLPETPVRRALREETERTMEFARMLVGPLEGAFLHVMTRLVQATHVLEIGMFTGYSALCFAEALPDQGRVVTCEVDEDSAAVARRFFAQSPHGRKIETCMGPALDTLAGLTGTFDFTLDWSRVSDFGPGADLPDDAPPRFIEALQKQLGLRLRSAKGPVEVLRVDRIERPTEN